MATRFDAVTWAELQAYRRRKNITAGYIYGTPVRISETLPVEAVAPVFEMNNSTNRVMGVSLVKNYLRMDSTHTIYSDRNYNRFVYKGGGNTRIDRAAMSRQEELVMRVFDALLFKGKTHIKRGQGIQAIPEKLYANKGYRVNGLTLENYVRNMFAKRSKVTE